VLGGGKKNPQTMLAREGSKGSGSNKKIMVKRSIGESGVSARFLDGGKSAAKQEATLGTVTTSDVRR